MLWSWLADLVVLIHVGFVVFVVVGGLLVWRWPRLAWVHLPAVVWAIGIEWTGGICPLTPLENWLRLEAGGASYRGDFVARYLVPVLYPAGLTRTVQVWLGLGVLVINLAAYGLLRHRRRRGAL